jgi:hypothetical protein
MRDVPHALFCVGGPGLTPHVVVQQLLGRASAPSSRSR